MKKDEDGFSLLEVMIGLAILSGVVFTVIAGLNYNLGLSSNDRDLVLAATLGRQKAEEAALQGIPDNSKGRFDGELSRFSWDINSSDTDIQGLRRLNISIGWDKERKLGFASYLQKK